MIKTKLEGSFSPSLRHLCQVYNRETSSDECEVSGYSVTIECSFHTLVIEEYLLSHCNFLQIVLPLFGIY